MRYLPLVLMLVAPVARASFGHRYTGSFRGGQADGFGVCLTDGSLIEGEWDNGCMHKGLLVFAVGKPASQCR